ncbi:MAG TPA: hypothetical protein VF713_16855 [Thermoanaerobaculia bacterium]
MRNVVQHLFRRAPGETGTLPRRRAFLAVAVLATLIGIVEWKRLPRAPFDSLSYDGFRYLAGACSLLDHGRYLDIAAEPQRTWPPGTSLLYAALARVTGQKPEQLVTFVGLMSYLLIAIALAMTMRTTIRRWPVAALGFVAIALNFAIINLTNRFWSEPPALTALMWGLLMTIDAVDRRSESRMLAAALLFSLAILFRFALIATVPLAFVAAAIASGRLRTPVLMLLIPAPMIVVLRVLAPGAHTGAPFRISSLPFAEDWKGLTELANQIFPAQLGWAGALLFVALIGSVIWVAGSAGVQHGSRETAMFVHFGWIVLYAMFLLLAQWIWVSPAPVIDLRMLLPLYPSIVIVLMTGVDRLMDSGSRVLAAFTVLAVAVGTARALHPLVQRRPHPVLTCASWGDVAASIDRLAPRLHGELASNAQGLAWFVLRRPIRKLSEAKAGSLIIFVDGSRTCPDTVETTEFPKDASLVAADGSVMIVRW